MNIEGRMVMDGYLERLLLGLKLSEQLVSGTEYVEWLSKFTSRHAYFTDSDWDENSKDISAEDSDKVNMLSVFFNGLLRYFDKNMIEPTFDEVAMYCEISYKNFNYKIGVSGGQGSYTFVERHDKQKENSISFEDIVEKKEHEYLALKKEYLTELDTLLNKMKALGVPYAKIEEIVQKER